tara:strand:- start:430 stop:2328 length:1899 start_codon:yes stop_codon:yes gene_type:complete
MGGAGSAGGAGLDVNDVFSTHLYTGTGSSQTITNNIDLSTEGGIVWLKNRGSAGDHYIVDNVMGVQKHFKVNGGTLENNSDGLTAFNNNGFTIGSWGDLNTSTNTYVSWTWRKAPKYFDVISYTGNGTAGRTISHGLGCDPGMIIIHSTANNRAGVVWHRGYSSTTQGYMYINSTNAEDLSSNLWNSTAPTSSVITLGTNSLLNSNGETYVAYVFAHNDDDGEFGPASDQDIIKCGSYSGNQTTKPSVNLGFEPQLVLIKAANTAESWTFFDNMRGVLTGGNDAYILTDVNDAENSSANWLDFTSTGFNLTINNSRVNANSVNYIYMAIRRGPLAVPTDATKVFDASVTSYSANQRIVSAIDVTDLFMVARKPSGNSSNGVYLFSRLTGNLRLRTDQTFGENAEAGLSGFDTQLGVIAGGSDSGENVWNGTFIKYFLKRAPGYFDVVAWEGAAGSLSSVKHNLGVTPDLVILKYRGASDAWYVYNSATTGVLNLNTNGATSGSTNYMASTTATDLNVSLVSNPANSPIAYLFATCPGVSKVGSVAHSGSSTDVDCGFSSGAKFVMLKRTDDTGDWFFWDTVRGIASGNDPYLAFNTYNQAEVTNTDYIDPLSSGFQISGDFTDGTYLFLAIA